MKTIRIALVLASAFFLVSSCFLLPLGEEDFLVAKGVIDPILRAGTALPLETGSLEPQWFTLHAVSGTVYQLGFSYRQNASPSFTDSSSLTMELYASDKNTLIGTKADDFMVFMPRTTGDYSVKVFSSSASYLSSYSVFMEESSTTALGEDIWANGSIVRNGSAWYRFDAVEDVSYFIQWNERNYGDGTKTADIRVSAYSAENPIPLFFDQDSAYSTPREITPAVTGPIILHVFTGSASSGTYGIKYKEADPPVVLADGVWMDGTIAVNQILWYTFEGVAGDTYYINSNSDYYGTSSYGDGTKTANIAVAAYHEDRVTEYFSSDYNGGYTTPWTIVPVVTGTIYVRVTTQYSYDGAGTFGIRYRHAIPVSLTDNVWLNGTITTGDILWYSFPVTADEPYYVSWNESGGTVYGDGTKTGNITVTAYGSDKTTAYFSSKDYAYSTPLEIIPTATGNVYLKVSTRSAGTFGIRSLHGTTMALADDVWSNGTISVGDILWYSFSATAGTVYDIAWNETGAAPYGDTTKTGNITVSVYENDRTTPYYTSAYYAFTTPLTVISPASGNVYLKISAEAAGTYAVRFRDTAIPAALSLDVWTPGTISAGETLWYSFPVEGGERYYINWNETGSAPNGDNTQSGDITVSGYVNGTLTACFTGGDYAFTSNRYIDAGVDGTAYIKVEASTPPGTFQIRYRQSATIPLSDNVYAPGTIASGEEVWFSFPAVPGEAYNVYLNRSGTGTYGDGSQTAAVYMSGYHADRSTSYFTSENEAFTNPVKVYAGQSGWVFLRIYSGTGSFEVKYQTIPRATLTQGVAYQDALLTGEIRGYSFIATSGTTYYIIWDDSYTNAAYTCHVYVSASLGGVYIFTYSSVSTSFTAASSGTVNIYVGGYNSSPGTFAIRYTSP